LKGQLILGKESRAVVIARSCCSRRVPARPRAFWK
jgi:hypothetical protein